MKNFLLGALTTIIILVLVIAVFLFYLVHKVESMDQEFIFCLKNEMLHQEYNPQSLESVEQAILKITKNECSQVYDQYLSDFLHERDSSEMNRKLFSNDDYIKRKYSDLFYEP